MREAQTILQMIETVDPADSAKLDEIDARVWCWYVGREYASHNGEIVTYGMVKGEGIASTCRTRRYTRSRDALKAIRPEGWTFFCGRTYPHVGPSEIYAGLKTQGRKLLENQTYATGKTEELAELHATIQAIEYERENETRD